MGGPGGSFFHSQTRNPSRSGCPSSGRRWCRSSLACFCFLAKRAVRRQLKVRLVRQTEAIQAVNEGWRGHRNCEHAKTQAQASDPINRNEHTERQAQEPDPILKNASTDTAVFGELSCFFFPRWSTGKHSVIDIRNVLVLSDSAPSLFSLGTG